MMRGVKPLQLGFLAGSLLSCVFVVGFLLGAVVQQSTAPTSTGVRDPNVQEFLSAYHLVTQHSYYRPLDHHHLIYAAIDGMLAATGDPHTLFLSPSENQVANTQLNGSQFGGIGAIVVPDRGNLQIVAPLPHTPASRAGLRAGDIVTQINGTPITRIRTDAVGRIHGRAGTRVRLTIVRGHSRPHLVSVMRARIPPITAFGRVLPHHLGYVQIMSFGAGTASEVHDALSVVLAAHVRGIILDLRDDPGGYVDTAQQIVSQFVGHGVVAYEKDSKHGLQPLPALPGRQVVHVPVLVLVNGGTASAAEITTAALHDDAGATVMGTRTYGKGSMQSVYALSDGSSIRITDRLWLTPRKRSIQKVGIEPDIPVVDSGVQSSSSDVMLRRGQQFLQHYLSR